MGHEKSSPNGQLPWQILHLKATHIRTHTIITILLILRYTHYWKVASPSEFVHRTAILLLVSLETLSLETHKAPPARVKN